MTSFNFWEKLLKSSRCCCTFSVIFKIAIYQPLLHGTAQNIMHKIVTITNNDDIICVYTL